MGYPYGQGQGQYGQDSSVTGQQAQPGSQAAPYGGQQQQQMPYGQMRMFQLFQLTLCHIEKYKTDFVYHECESINNTEVVTEHSQGLANWCALRMQVVSLHIFSFCLLPCQEI